MNNFEQLNLSSNLIKGLQKQGITSPTEVQTLVFENIKNNKDMVIQAQTGSGKTLSYLLPLFEKIDTTKRETQVIILAPTHELVMQIVNQVKILSQNSEVPVTTLPLIGEVNIQKQIKNIKDTKPHIVVGSCGRIFDLIKQRKLKVHTVKTIVLDEVDSLLSGKNTSVVKDIIKCTLRDRQLLAFSASTNVNCLDICSSLMKEPIIIKSAKEADVNENISHMYLLCDRRDKFKILRKALAAVNPQKAIVFVNDEESIEVISEKLNYHGRRNMAISGNMSKEDRKVALDKFKSGKVKILVSSDLSARGLDIQNITHVFNLDFPVNKHEYIHRSGRTARGKNKGDTISIVTNQELGAIRVYAREFDIDVKRKDLHEGNLIDFK